MQTMNSKIEDNVLKKYGQYTKRVNGEVIKSVFEWFERPSRHTQKRFSPSQNTNDQKHYRLEITKDTFDQYNTASSHFRRVSFSQFCELLTPVITGYGDDNQLRHTFTSLDSDNDNYLNVRDIEILLIVTDRLEKANQIHNLISQITMYEKVNFDDFKQFISRGYGRELLMSAYENIQETL